MLKLNIAVDDSFVDVFGFRVCSNLGAILQLLETLVLEVLRIKKALTTGVLGLGANLHKGIVLLPKLSEGDV